MKKIKNKHERLGIIFGLIMLAFIAFSIIREVGKFNLWIFIYIILIYFVPVGLYYLLKKNNPRIAADYVFENCKKGNFRTHFATKKLVTDKSDVSIYFIPIINVLCIIHTFYLIIKTQYYFKLHIQKNKL